MKEILALVFCLFFLVPIVEADEIYSSHKNLYKSLLMSDGTYVILQNTNKDITKPYTSCAVLKKGANSFSGDMSGSPSACWVVWPWSPCSTTCGNGIITRTVGCFDLNGNPSSDCNASIKPSEQGECSSTKSCEYSWATSDWETCPTDCGSYTTTRAVSCVKNEVEQVEDIFCEAQNKPATSRDCTETPKCVYAWVVSEWSECPTGCGQVARTRSIACVKNNIQNVDNLLCDSNTQPTTTEQCSLPNYDSCSFNILASSDNNSIFYVSNKNGDIISEIGRLTVHQSRTYTQALRPDDDGYIWIRVDWNNALAPGGIYLQDKSTGQCWLEHSTPGKTGTGRAGSEWIAGPCWVRADTASKSHVWLYKYKVF